jgi:AraC-like DNA-binding protein
LRDRNNEWSTFSSAIIRASHLHQLDSNDSIQLFIYLDSDSEYAEKLTHKYLKNRDISDLKTSDIGKISSGFFKELLVSSDCNKLFQGFLTIIEHLIHFENPIEKDQRVIEAITFITLNKSEQLRVKDIAEHVSLSESRLRFLFKKQVGQPIQSFMLWIKVINSLNLVLKGEKITNTAYNNGFWDASHMNRSFKETLGIKPSAIKQYEKELKIITCQESNFFTFRTEILKDWSSQKPFKTIDI